MPPQRKKPRIRPVARSGASCRRSGPSIRTAATAAGWPRQSGRPPLAARPARVRRPKGDRADTGRACGTRRSAPPRSRSGLAGLGINLPSRLARLLHLWKAGAVARVALLLIGNKVLHHLPPWIEESGSPRARRMAALHSDAAERDRGNDNGTIAVASFHLTRPHFALSALSWLSSADAISFGNCAA
jgi:hypothetical protein